MNTRTDLANRSLSYLGQMAITDIDEGSKNSRTCKEFMDDTIREVLRSHRWNCASKRAILTELTEVPTWGYSHAYELPADFLRLMEVNGEQFEDSQKYFEIENGKRLLSNWDDCQIRYIANIGIPDFDPCLADAVAIKLASKIIVPLQLSQDGAAFLIARYREVLNEARRIDAVETGSRENPQYERLLFDSPLIRSRNAGSWNWLNYLHPFRF